METQTTSTDGMGPTQLLIKRLRSRGLSQSEISRRTSIPQPRLSRWENEGATEVADDVFKLQALEAEEAAKR